MVFKPSSKDNFIWLLTALVALQFFNSLFSQLGLRGANILVNISMTVMVLMSVWSLQEVRTRWFGLKFVVALLVVILMVVDSSIKSNWLAPFQLITMFAFVSITIYLAWQQVMFTGEITRNTIFGSICIYILIGLQFGFAYLMVERVFPGSLVGLDGETWQENLQVTIYYSMVTLTTLGYGDITPAGQVTCFLAYTEAMVGVFYTTILVASLIGLHLSGLQSDKTNNPDT
jgi:voltage-gated potassium channel Kch